MSNQARVLTILAAVVFSGCIKRTEKITIHADGSAQMETTFQGDPSDVRAGDAAPSVESAWEVSESTQTDDEGKEQLTLEAKQSIAAGEDYPSSYAPPGSKLAALALQFPTTLTIEQREDGTCYHFRRVYGRRPFAFAHYWDEKAKESEEFKAVATKDPAEVTSQEMEEFAQRLIKMDAQMTAAFLERAVANIEFELPQEVFLAVFGAAVSVYDDPDLGSRLGNLLRGEQADTEMEALEQEVRSNISQAVQSALQDAGTDQHSTRHFLERYQLERDRYEITEDLGDEQWIVSVQLPGQIIAHNTTEKHLQPTGQPDVVHTAKISATVAVGERNGRQVTDEISFEGTSSKVTWEFDGNALRDRDVILMATSFLPNDQTDQ